MKDCCLICRAILWVALLSLLPAGSGVFAGEAPAEPPRLLGTRPFDAEVMEDLGPRMLHVERATAPVESLPRQVKNWRYLPVVRNQQLNNCGAFAPSYYYKTYQEARERDWLNPDPETHPERVMSPGFTYPLTNGGEDQGANVATVMEVICRYGIAPWETIPETYYYNEYPFEDAWRAAIPFRGNRVLSFDVSTDSGIAALKEHLAGGDLAVMACKIYSDTHHNNDYGYFPVVGEDRDVIYDNGVEFVDFHAFTIIGYDDDKPYTEGGIEKTGAFLAVNSWGPYWGVYDADMGTRGFAWFSYEYVKSRRGGTMAGPVVAMEDRIGYEPIDLAVLDMVLMERMPLQLNLYVGSQHNRLSDLVRAFPTGGGLLPFDGRWVVDITEFSHLDPVCVTAVALDQSNHLGSPVGSLRGQIRELTIERGDGGRIFSSASVDNPVQVRAGELSTVHAGPLHEMDLPLDEELANKSVRMALADWNRDGKADLAIGGGMLLSSSMLRIYRNRGDETGSQYPLAPDLDGLTNVALGWVDMDRDGLVDLAAIGMVDWSQSSGVLYRNLAPVGFEAAMELPALTYAAMAWGDYNNNGAPDLAVAGSDANGVAQTRLLRNDGAGNLIDSGLVFEGKSDVSVSWADVNSNGWLDLLVGGHLYQNNGDGTFTLRRVFGDNPSRVRHAWGDFDGDGLLDLAWCAVDFGWWGTDDFIVSRIYRNAGDFEFVDIEAGLVGVYGGSMAWGDFDNDGRLDLALSGYPTDTWDEKTTRIYRQQPDGSFRDIGAALPPVAGGDTLWGDFTGNGLLDLYVTGHAPNDPDVMSFTGATSFHANMLANPNNPPSAPTGLTASWDAGNGEVVLTWNPAEDSETPSASLSYRVRMGTWSEGADIISPADEWGLLGPHPPMRVAPGQPGRRIRDLAPGRYFWSVQAIDGSHAHSEWSPRQMFVLGGGGLISGDANGDGKIDIADVVTILRMANGQVDPRPDLVDLDGNGRVDVLDAQILANMLVDSEVDGAYTSVAQHWFDGSGGDLGALEYGIQILVPDGVGPTPFDLEVEVSTTDQSFGPDAEPFAWKISGLPLDTQKPITVRVLDIRADRSDPPFVVLGTEGFVRSLGQVKTGFQIEEARVADEGWLEFDVPAMHEPEPLSGRTLQADRSGSSPLAKYEHTLVIYLLSASQWKYDGGNFRIFGPMGTKDKLPALAADLEEALAYYRDTLGFDLSRRDWEGYPLVVTVYDLGKGPTGEPTAGYAVSSTNYNKIAMEIHTVMLDDPLARRVTLAHELFHVVQALYDTRGRIARATTAPNLWLDEATATYMESHFAPAGYIPDLLNTHKRAMLQGYNQAERLSNTIAGNYGYGSAPMITHLVARNGGNVSVVRTLYEKIQSGKTSLEALSECFPDHPMRMWYSSLLGELLKDVYYPGRLYPIGLLRAELAGKERQLTLKEPNQLSLIFPWQSFQALSGGYSFVQIDPSYPAPTGDERLAFQVKSNAPLDIDLSVYKYRRVPGDDAQIELMGRGAVQADKGRLELQLPNAKDHFHPMNWFVPVISNIREHSPFTNYINTRLRFGIVRDFENHPISPHDYRFGTVYIFTNNTNWPIFTASGSFTAMNATEIREHYKNPATPNTIPTLNIYPWGDPIEPITIQYRAQPQSQTHYGEVDNYSYSLIYRGGLQYRLQKYRFDGTRMSSVFDGPWEDAEIFSKTLYIEDDETVVGYSIGLRYNYHAEIRNLFTGQTVVDEELTRTTTSSFVIHLHRR